MNLRQAQVLADNPQKRVDYHLQELTKALQEQYPEAKLFGRAAMGKLARLHGAR